MIGSFSVGWRQVAVCFLLLASASMITSTYGVIAGPLAKEFQPSRMVLMLAMTVFSAVCGVLSPVLGNLMDRSSLRRLMLLGAVLLGAGYLALSYATAFEHVLIAFGLLLAPASVLLGPMAVTVLLSRWFVKRRGLAMGVALAGIAMGGVAFPPLVQSLLDGQDWRDAMRVFAAILLVLTVPMALLVTDSPADKGLNPDGAAASPDNAGEGKRSPSVSIGTILADPAFWLIALLFAIVLSGMTGMVTNLVPLATDTGIAPADAALLISIFAGSGFVAKLAFAATADRLPLRVLTYLGFAGFAAGMAILSQAAAGYWIIALGVGLTGLCGGLMMPLKSLLVPRIFGQHVVGRAMGLISMVSLCTLLATPPLFGLVFDLTGSYTGVLLTFAVLAATAVLLVPYIRMHPRAPEPERALAA